jgi:hypothetical protein
MTDERVPSPAAGRACPDAEALAALALGEGAPEARAALADHVVTCSSCAADFRLLRALHAEASPEMPEASVAGPAGAPRKLPRRRWVLGAAAAALVAAGLGPLLLQKSGDRVRGPDVAVQPGNGAVLDAPPPELAWPAEPNARAYRVRLFRADSTPAWDSGEIPVTTAALPAGVRESMRPGDSFYWTVQADGPVRQPRIGPFWFQIVTR